MHILGEETIISNQKMVKLEKMSAVVKLLQLKVPLPDNISKHKKNHNPL